MSDIQTTNYPSTAKVLVRSENMSRTALGIAHAYMLIYPNSTVESLNKAFPKEEFGQGSDLFLGPNERKAYVGASQERREEPPHQLLLRREERYAQA